MKAAKLMLVFFVLTSLALCSNTTDENRPTIIIDAKPISPPVQSLFSENSPTFLQFGDQYQNNAQVSNTVKTQSALESSSQLQSHVTNKNKSKVNTKAHSEFLNKLSSEISEIEKEIDTMKTTEHTQKPEDSEESEDSDLEPLDSKDEAEDLEDENLRDKEDNESEEDNTEEEDNNEKDSDEDN